MFFSKSKLEGEIAFLRVRVDLLKSKLEGEIAFLRVRVDLLSDVCEQLETRIERLEAARWGLKVDGTPKAKPGRKSKEAKDVRIS